MSSSGSVGMMRADVANETDVLERGPDGYIPSDFVPRSRPQDTTLSSPVHTSNRPVNSAVRDRIRMFDAERAEGDSNVALYDFSRDGHARRGIRFLQGMSPRACVGIVVLAVLAVSTVIGFALMGDDNSQRPVSKAAQVVSADAETHRGEAREKSDAESSDHGSTGASPNKKEAGAQEGSHGGHEAASQPITVAVVCNVVHPG